MTSHDKHFIVLGAGVVGLSTAFELQKQFDNCTITIVAEASTAETTSYGAGGLWEPYNVAGTPESKVNEWGLYSYQHFQECERQGIPGISSVRVYQLYHPLAEQEFNHSKPFWSEIVQDLHLITPQEKVELKQQLGEHIELASTGCFTYVSIIADQTYYLKWLRDQLQTNGSVKFIDVPQKLHRLRDVMEVVPSTHKYDLVCNCSGLGSYFMHDIHDTQLNPVKGQVVRIKKPTTAEYQGNAYTYETENALTYILPNHQTIVLGGTAEVGEFDMTVDPDVTARILNNAAALLPELLHMETVSAWCGRRPTRKPLRMEIEEHFTGLPCPVLHLYGHGGCGVTIGLGSAHDAVQNMVGPYFIKVEEKGTRMHTSGGGKRSKI